MRCARTRLLTPAALGARRRLERQVNTAERVPRRRRPLILVAGVVLVDEQTSGIHIAAGDVAPAELVIVRTLLIILVDAREDHVLRLGSHRDQSGLGGHLVEGAVSEGDSVR